MPSMKQFYDCFDQDIFLSIETERLQAPMSLDDMLDTRLLLDSHVLSLSWRVCLSRNLVLMASTNTFSTTAPLLA